MLSGKDILFHSYFSSMLIEALFAITKKLKHAKYTLTDEWKFKYGIFALWYSKYSAVKKSEIINVIYKWIGLVKMMLN